MIFLQETYNGPDLEGFWRAEWGGKILFALDSKHSKGVMILFKTSLSVDVLKTTADKNGRFLVANININEDELRLVSIYAPYDQNQQINFFGKILGQIRCNITSKIFVGGDFNCQVSAFDKVGGKDVLHKKKVIQAIQDFCNNVDLVDDWRTQHPNETHFSWENCLGKIKCGLDSWLISKQLFNRVTKTDINDYYDTDHSPVTILIGPEEKQKQRGPGLWKLNNSLLENEELVSKMNFTIKIAKEKHKNVTEKRLFWEMVKIEIRIFFIRFAKKKAGKKKYRTGTSSKLKLDNLNSLIDAASEESHLVCEARMLKIKLDRIAVQKTKSSIVRSRSLMI